MALKVVATVLVGPGTEHLIPDAIESARGLAEKFILIDTRTGELPILPNLPVLTPELAIEWFQWQGDYAAARNAALGFAAIYGATHALTLDTDERLDGISALELGRSLEEHPEADVFLLRDETFSYYKERIIRLASKPWWNGPTHEELLFGKDSPVSCVTLPGHFRELTKDPDDAATQAKLKSHADTLERWLRDDPTRAKCRWYRFIGESYFGLKQWEKAHEYFWRGCADDKRGSLEERAWCCFRSGECFAVLGNPAEALRAAAFTLNLHSGFAREAGWLGGWACMQLGNYELALNWAQIGITNPPPPTRRGTVNPKALDGCIQIVANIAEATGNGDIAARAADLLREA